MHAAKISFIKFVLGIAIFMCVPKSRILLGDKFPKKPLVGSSTRYTSVAGVIYFFSTLYPNLPMFLRNITEIDRKGVWRW